MVFVRFEDDEPVGLFVTNVDGSGLRQLTPDGMLVDEDGFGGRWSPDGSQILVVARATRVTTRPSGSSTRTAANPSPWR